MKKWFCLAAVAVILLTPAIGLWHSARAETERISVAGVTPNSAAYQALAQAHPEAEISATLTPYLSTTELINDLLTGGFAYDAFVISSNQFDVDVLIDKGYCAELSDKPEIAEAVGQMMPAFSGLVSRDGRVYGIPYNCRLEYMTYSAEAWAQLGFSDADVPASFADFLTFLERWVDRAETEDLAAYSIFGSFDEELYSETSYADYLVQLLMDNHILQCSYAQAPLRFSSPEFRQCLERCMEVGKKLYALEPVPNQGLPIFELSNGLEKLNHLVPLRLTEEQPAVIKTNVNVCMVFANTQVKAMAEDFALAMLREQGGQTALALLLQDGTPVENPGYADNVAFWEEQVAALQKEIDSNTLSPADRRDRLLELERFEGVLQDVSSEESRYLISPEMLAVYQSYRDRLFVQPPHYFLPIGEGGEAVKTLRARCVSGLIDVEQFIRKLDEMATMMALEE